MFSKIEGRTMWETEIDGMTDSLRSGVRNGLGRERTDAEEPVMWPLPQ